MKTTTYAMMTMTMTTTTANYRATSFATTTRTTKTNDCKDEIVIGVEAIMMYWFPEHALIGKRPVLSVYSLLRGYTLMKLDRMAYPQD